MGIQEVSRGGGGGAGGQSKLCCIDVDPSPPPSKLILRHHYLFSITSNFVLFLPSPRRLPCSKSIVHSLPQLSTFISCHSCHIYVAVTCPQLSSLMVLLASAQAVAAQTIVTSGGLCRRLMNDAND